MERSRVRSRLTMNELLLRISEHCRVQRSEFFGSSTIAQALHENPTYTSKKLSSMRKAGLIALQLTPSRHTRFGYNRGIRNVYTISAHGQKRISFLKSTQPLEQLLLGPKTRPRLRAFWIMNSALSQRVNRVEQASAEKTKLIEKCQRVMLDVVDLLTQLNSTELPDEHKRWIENICLYLVDERKKLSRTLSRIENQLAEPQR